MTFSVLLLVCATAIARPDCQPETAINIITGPEASNEVQCGLHGQAYIATTQVAPKDGEYLKIKCIRTTIGKSNVG